MIYTLPSHMKESSNFPPHIKKIAEISIERLPLYDFKKLCPSTMFCLLYFNKSILILNSIIMNNK